MICVSIGIDNYDKQIEYVQKFEFVEYRIDLCKPDIKQLKNILEVSTNIILSFRNINDLNFLQYIDLSKIKFLDLDHTLIESLLKENLNEFQEKLIISNHFDYFDVKVLKSAINTSLQFNPTIIKIAVKINNKNELRNLLSLYDNNYQSKLLIIGMGYEGRISRICSELYGAPFTFAAPARGEETAPGQFTYDEMRLIQNEQ